MRRCRGLERNNLIISPSPSDMIFNSSLLRIINSTINKTLLLHNIPRTGINQSTSIMSSNDDERW